MLARRFLAALALSLAACSPIVEAQFSDIEVTRPNISIPPAPTAALSSVTFSFSIDSSRLGASSKPEVQQGIVAVKLHRLALTAKTGITDLSFVETLHALACVPTSKTSTLSARQVEIADYTRSGEDPGGPDVRGADPRTGRPAVPAAADGDGAALDSGDREPGW